MPRLSSHFGLKDPRFSSVTMPTILPLTVAAAATLTPAQTMTGMIIYTGAAANLTLPTAAALVDAIQGGMVGTSYELLVRATGAGTVTMVAGAGGTINGTATVATANSRMYMFNLTNVTIGLEAYVVYAEATGTH